MSLLATSYRYEIDGSKRKSLQKALAREESRIKEDEMYAEQTRRLESNQMVNEVSKWTENLEEASGRRRVKMEKALIKEEIRLGSKASIMVRKAQLKQLLTTEHAKYEEELNKLGLAFYQERL
ncbi:cilia- and flagella-associated protein 141-like [Clytia hemisphaerica]|uniref:Uncharacterized protein n=1 Tax=Clytia hemisphaerica TaxID=252671 RepID=A0A7M5XF67_9CNID